MMRWVGMMLRLFIPYKFNMHVRGTPKRFHKILNYIQYNNLFKFKFRPHVYYIFVKNKYNTLVTRRAIRRRIVKRIKLQ